METSYLPGGSWQRPSPSSRSSAIRGGYAASLSDLGHLHRLLGDEAAARAHYERSLALRRALGDTYGVATSLFRLGSIALVAGDDALARAYLEDSTALAERVGTVETALPQGLLGLLACEFGDLTRSQALLTEAVRRSDAKRWPASLALTLPAGRVRAPGRRARASCPRAPAGRRGHGALRAALQHRRLDPAHRAREPVAPRPSFTE